MVVCSAGRRGWKATQGERMVSSQPRIQLDFVGTKADNSVMVIAGDVHNGVVVLEGGITLPEGAAVTVSYPVPAVVTRAGENRRIEVPLVRTGQPGSVNLTGRQIAEILDKEDAASRR